MQKFLNTLAAIAAGMILFFLAPTASAQATDCNPVVAHAHLQLDTSAMCGGGTVPCNCTCDAGWHTRESGPPSADNPCVRNVRGDRDGDGDIDIANTICIGDAVPTTSVGGFVSCQCPDTLDTTDHDADDDGIRETRRVAVLWDRDERRAMGVALTGAIMDCQPENALASQADIDGAAMESRISALEDQIRATCGSDATTPADLTEDCAAFNRAALASGGSPTTVTVGGTEYSIGDFAQRVADRLTALENNDARQDDELGDHETRLTALEDAREAPSMSMQILHLRLGGFGRLALTTGPATGAGGAAGELLIRFGDVPFGWYARVEFGGQETAWNVGSSMLLGGGTGLTYFTGGAIRRDTLARFTESVRAGRRSATLSLGLSVDDLLHPYADAPNAVQGSHLGWSIGAEISASIPLPGEAYWLRIRPGLSLGYAERYWISNGAFSVGAGVVITPSLGIEVQPDL